MRKPRGAGLLALAAALALFAPSAPVRAQITLLERDDLTFTLAGYVRALTAVHDLGFDAPGAERRTGFHAQVVRVKWQARGSGWTVDVHDRLQARVSSAPGQSSPVGFGVSAVPDRLVDLETVLLGEDRLRIAHDIDRLSVTVLTDAVDLTIGRQPITWGISALFPVADLWAQFSPFELDTEEKPGIDAVRALFYPAGGLEVDAVVADRGSWDDLSAGVRATLGLDRADVWAGAGKFWREVIALGGVAFLLDETRLRAELALPWLLDGGGLDRPRGTVGADWIRGRLTLTGEYHYNGIGAARDDGYVAQLVDPRFLRGESYYLGRHYLGALAAWAPDEEGRFSLALNALVNLTDPSAALTPLVGYDIGQNTSLSVGALLSLGESPVVSAPPRLRSEFGTYGTLGFTRVSVYF